MPSDNLQNLEDFIANNNLKGLDFIKSVLEFEQKRFDKYFLKGSVYEKINSHFGIFPARKVYPVYFVGNIEKPDNKTIFLGINPGYNEIENEKEQKFTEESGIFYSSCHFFDYYKGKRKGLIPYYANIAGFLKRLDNIEQIDWDWLQDNLINLEMIPYHSSDASGLRINDLQYYRKTYFEIFLRTLNYLKPNKPIFINGFPTFERYFKDRVFQDIVSFRKIDTIWKGKIKDYSFIGLPFLNRPKGGKDKLVSLVKREL